MSYTWGDPNVAGPLIVGDAQLHSFESQESSEKAWVDGALNHNDFLELALNRVEDVVKLSDDNRIEQQTLVHKYLTHIRIQTLAHNIFITKSGYLVLGCNILKSVIKWLS